MVILVHSLVEGGTAEKDGRLKVGDRVVHVNHVYTTGQPLEFAVEQLMSVPLGSVAVIGVNHPLPVSSDCSSNPCSPLSRVSFFSEGGEFGGVVNGMENFFEEGTQSTVVDSVELHHTQDVSTNTGRVWYGRVWAGFGTGEFGWGLVRESFGEVS